MRFRHTVDTFILRSGATFVHVTVPGLPYSIVGIGFRAGSRFDPPKRNGLAHFLEHLFEARKTGRLAQGPKMQYLESLGITSEARTSHETATYYHIQSHEQTLESLTCLIEGFSTTRFHKRDINRERHVIVDEIARSGDKVEAYLWEKACQNLWPQSKLSKPLLGTRKSIASISLSDILAFKKNFYKDKNTTFVVIDDERKSGAKIKKYLDKIRRPGSGAVSFSADRFSKPRTVVFHTNPLSESADRIQVGLYYRTVPVSKPRERLLLAFIRDYLASGWMSRFIDTLRVKHNLTYWVEADSGAFSDTGYLEFRFSVEKKNLKKSLKLIFSEIEKLREHPILPETLEEHKKFRISSFVRDSTDPHMLYSWYSDDAILGAHLFDYQTYVEAMKKYNSSEITAAAGKYLVKSNLTAVFLGKFSPADKQELKELVRTAA